MRRLLFGILSMLLVAAAGCARQSRPAARDVAHDSRFDAAEPAAAALVFEPAIVRNRPPLELSRDGRDTQAFVGYAAGVVEYFYVRWDDSQSAHGYGRYGTHDHYERRAISEKVGVLYR